jgi:curved DNA-binding protein CbpA
MNYYEELGIKPDADVDEIRKAHRRLVKLMHPDQQRDPSLKQLAETQMRRLNSIVSTLLDPEQREEYDEDLRDQQIVRPVPQKAWRTIPWWIASTAGAVVLTVGAVWIWADHLGSSFSRSPVYIPPQTQAADPGTAAPPPTRSASPAEKPERVTRPTVLEGSKPTNEARTPAESDTAKTIDPPKPGKSAASNSVPPQSAGREIAAEQRKFHLPPGLQPNAASGMRLGAPLPPAPGLSANAYSHDESATSVLPALPSALAAAPKPDIPKADPPGSSGTVTSASGFETLAGEWVYAPKEPEKRKPGFYPPEFIRLKLADNDGALHGQYSARYEVTGNKQPISPEVTFQVKATDKSAHKFTWQSSNGSRGTLAIHAIDVRTIRLEWRTTVFSGGPALTSGIATLVRRSVAP